MSSDPVYDAAIKVLLVFLGAFVGASVTLYVARRRVRNLYPLFLVQLKSVADGCIATFSCQEASVVAGQVDLALKFLSDGIGIEGNNPKWATGARCLQRCQRSLSLVVAGGDLNAAETTKVVRSDGKELKKWAMEAS